MYPSCSTTVRKSNTARSGTREVNGDFRITRPKTVSSARYRFGSSCASRPLHRRRTIFACRNFAGGMIRTWPSTTSSMASFTSGRRSHSSYVIAFELGKLAMHPHSSAGPDTPKNFVIRRLPREPGRPLLLVTLQRQGDQPVKQRGKAHAAMLPHLRIHADRGEAGDGIDLVDIQLSGGGFEQKIDPAHAFALHRAVAFHG